MSKAAFTARLSQSWPSPTVRKRGWFSTPTARVDSSLSLRAQYTNLLRSNCQFWGLPTDTDLIANSVVSTESDYKQTDSTLKGHETRLQQKNGSPVQDLFTHLMRGLITNNVLTKKNSAKKKSRNLESRCFKWKKVGDITRFCHVKDYNDEKDEAYAPDMALLTIPKAIVRSPDNRRAMYWALDPLCTPHIQYLQPFLRFWNSLGTTPSWNIETIRFCVAGTMKVKTVLMIRFDVWNYKTFCIRPR